MSIPQNYVSFNHLPCTEPNKYGSNTCILCTCFPKASQGCSVDVWLLRALCNMYTEPGIDNIMFNLLVLL